MDKLIDRKIYQFFYDFFFFPSYHSLFNIIWRTRVDKLANSGWQFLSRNQERTMVTAWISKVGKYGFERIEEKGIKLVTKNHAHGGTYNPTMIVLLVNKHPIAG